MERRKSRLQAQNLLVFCRFETFLKNIQALVCIKNSIQEKEESVAWRQINVSPSPSSPTAWESDVEGGLQDPALFLAREAAMAGEDLVYEVEEGEETAPGLLPTSVKLQLTYFESTVVVEEKTEASAVAKAAVKTLQQAGPWIREEDLDQVDNNFKTLFESFNSR